MSARVQTGKQVLQHELFPDMFDEAAPTSQLYENNEADAQTTRYVAKDFAGEMYSNAISGPKDEPKDEKQEDLQSLHLTRERGREERGKPRNKVVKKHMFRWRRQEHN